MNERENISEYLRIFFSETGTARLLVYTYPRVIIGEFSEDGILSIINPFSLIWYKGQKMCNRIAKPCQIKKRCNNSGFSLIELSIVLTVIGLLMVPLIHGYDVYKTQKIVSDTKFALSLANQALSNFYEEHGRYPCPSDRSIGFGEPGHGEERCTQLVALGNNSCGGVRARGYCRAATVPANPIFIGGVPYKSMTIPMTDAMDGWNNMFVYVVTGSMADPAGTFNPDNGAVTLQDEFGVLHPELLHGVIFSAGADGVGAFNINGIERPCVNGTVQTENCDNDGRFTASDIYDAPGASFYDDYLVMSDWSRNSIWAYSTAEDVYNTNPGNVGIGTQTPTAKLDVVGNIRSDSVHTVQYCNPNGTDCFPAEIIGGVGRQCGSGEVMIGFANRNVVCRPLSTNVTGTCPSGQFVTGIASGRVVCAAP